MEKVHITGAHTWLNKLGQPVDKAVFDTLYIEQPIDAIGRCIDRSAEKAGMLVLNVTHPGDVQVHVRLNSTGSVILQQHVDSIALSDELVVLNARKTDL